MAALVVGLIGSFAILSLVTLPPTLAAVSSGRSAKTKLDSARTALSEQRFTDAIQATDQAVGHLRQTRNALRRLVGLEPLPFVGTQLLTIRLVVDLGLDLSSALKDGTLAARQVIGPLQQGKGNVSLATLTPADKRQILERLSQAGPLLQSVQEKVVTAAKKFEMIPRHGLLPALESLVAPLREQFPFIESTVSQLVPATQIIPAVSGFPSPKNYLFLLENNSELRPTGGFIGTYGILKVAAGEITSFATNDVYTLDHPARNTLYIAPPDPLQRYNATTQWFFRDSNWSPDFPTAALKALDFYRLENGPEKKLDGVIAVTPVFISSLLKISGDITIDKITFTPDNLVDKLQARAERKELIGEMSKVLMNRILALPQRRWQELIGTVAKALEEKHLLLFSRDQELEEKIIAQNWGGAVRPLAGDGFLIIDANLAGLKTDSVMDRSVSYGLTVTDRDATANLKISYVNKGKLSRLTTRYRTFTRVYVPVGSALVSSSGAMQNDKLHGGRPGTVEVSSELNRTVFGAFISIEPGETGELSFTYTLPSTILQRINDGTYDLDVQKQSGTTGHGLTANLTFPKQPTIIKDIDGTRRIGHTGLALNSDLRTDRRLVVGF